LACSAVTVLMAAMVAQTPIPVAIREAISTSRLGAKPEASMPTVTSARNSGMVLRRPRMSDSGDSASAPMIMPNGAALNSRPSSVGFNPHSFETPVAVKEAIMMSKPSTMLMAMQIATAVICTDDIGRPRMARIGLAEAVGVMVAIVSYEAHGDREARPS
jgi:hypothetical protein